MSNVDEGERIHFVDAPGARLAVFVAGGTRDDLIVVLHGGPGVPDYLAPVATLLAVPLSWVLSYAIGVALVQVPLSFVFSAAGVLLWLVLVVVLSVLASLLPARRAWQLSVREVLAYE